MKEMNLSSADPSLTPASTPSVSDTGIMIKKVKKARMAVFAKLSLSRVATGTSFSEDPPRSPRAIAPSHFT